MCSLLPTSSGPLERFAVLQATEYNCSLNYPLASLQHLFTVCTLTKAVYICSTINQERILIRSKHRIMDKSCISCWSKYLLCDLFMLYLLSFDIYHCVNVRYSLSERLWAKTPQQGLHCMFIFRQILRTREVILLHV